MARKVLVAEKIAQEGIDVLLAKGYEVDERFDLTSEELADIIAPYDALIVRSATKVTPKLLANADNLKIIGRAGVTVDNIDLEAASSRGIIVCNAPTSNIISAAEHTMALLLACARNVAQANASMHKGEWTRHKFTGVELNGKTLAIYGLGRVGSTVAERARAFGMDIVAYDPYCSPDRASELGVKLFDDHKEILPIADFITLHLPLTDDTYQMFGPEEFALMKKGVIIVNSSRGGIINIDSLADFIAAGKVAAAAIDVFEEEPCTDSPLHPLEMCILTPHISAVTKEAQILAGTQIAEYVWAGLEGSIVPTAITSGAYPPEVMDRIQPFIPACKMMGRMLSQILGSVPKHLKISAEGKISDISIDALVAGALDGMIGYKHEGAIKPTNALEVASRHGIEIETVCSDSADEFSSAVRMQADGIEVAATLFGKDRTPRIITLLGYKIDIAPAKQGFIFEYVDAPGRIGTIGTILGNADINITTMQIGNKEEDKCALVYVNIEGEVSDAVIDELRSAIEFKNLWYITL